MCVRTKRKVDLRRLVESPHRKPSHQKVLKVNVLAIKLPIALSEAESWNMVRV